VPREGGSFVGRGEDICPGARAGRDPRNRHFAQGCRCAGADWRTPLSNVYCSL